MDLDLVRLRQFVVLVRAGSFARGARELHLSQPTLTRTVQTLEAQLGERLLDRARGRRGVVITPHGATLIRYAEQLLRLADEAAQEITQRPDAPEYLAFGMGPRLGSLLLPGVLAALIDERPNATFHVLTAPTSAMRRHLDTGEISFLIGIGTATRQTARLTSRLFAKTRPEFYVRRGHPLEGARQPTSEDLLQFPLLSGTDWPEGISSAGPDFDSRLFDTRVRIDNDDVLTELTRRSDAVMLSTLGPEDGLVALDFPLNPVDVLVFWNASLPLSGLAELVLSRLIEAAHGMEEYGR